MPVRLSRRSFTASLGASLIAAPFLNLLSSQKAKASGSAKAKRLLVFFTANGTIPRLWKPTGTTTSFSFPAGSMLEPLAPIASDVIILDEMNFYNADNHAPGMAAMLTNNGGMGTETNNMSVDQYVAQAIGGKSRFKSLEFGVETSLWGGNTQTRMSYSGPNAFMTPDDDPVDIYTRMFGPLLGGADGAAKLLARRTSVIDVARAEINDLYKRLGTTERAKLDAHLDALRTVETGLSAPVTSGSCTIPTKPAAVDVWGNDNFPTIAKSQMDLATQALSCGLTNVASIQLSHTVGDRVYSWLGLTDGHHTLSHSDDGNTTGVANFVTAERWSATQFVYLVNKLKSLPDPDGGGTLFDTTLVLWCKELGDSRLHIGQNVPWVLCGGGAYQNGRYLQLGGEHHAKVLTSICHAFGLNNTSFGDPAAGTGPLEVL